jgi:hypothetical protein
MRAARFFISGILSLKILIEIACYGAPRWSGSFLATGWNLTAIEPFPVRGVQVAAIGPSV